MMQENYLSNMISHDFIRAVQGSKKDKIELSTGALGVVKEFLEEYIHDLEFAVDPKEFVNALRPALKEYVLPLVIRFASGSNVENTKITILQCLISAVLKIDNDDPVINPWLMTYLLKENELFNVPDEANLLDSTTISVHTVDGPIDMTEECALGIIAFYQGLKLPHPLSIHGDKLFDETQFLETFKVSTIWKANRIFGGYTMSVMNVVYWFHTHDFIKGLLLAAKWNNLDYHECLSGLNQHKLITQIGCVPMLVPSLDVQITSLDIDKDIPH